jgi:hypothetical protein
VERRDLLDRRWKPARPHAVDDCRRIAAIHRLSCIVYGAPHATITVEAAIAHIRAAMGLGEPTATHPNGRDNESGASWFLGSGQDQQRIGVSIPASSSDTPASIVVIMQEHVP